MILGDNLIVIADLGGMRQAVAACKSCGLSIDRSYIEACSPTDGQTTRKIPTKYDWSIDCSCLMADSRYAEMLCDAATAGTLFTAEFICAGFKRKGEVLVKLCKMKGQKGSLAQLSAQLQGSGPLLNANNDGWDYHAGNLYTYAPFAEGALGYQTEADMSKNGTFTEDEQHQENNAIYSPGLPSES